MNKFLKILSYLSVPTMIAAGTVIYNAGKESEKDADKKDLILYRIEELSTTVGRIEKKLDSTDIIQRNSQDVLINLKKEVRLNTLRTEQKIDRIVDNMPDNSELIRQLYDIERAIKRKNDTIDLLMKRDVIKKNFNLHLTQLRL